MTGAAPADSEIVVASYNVHRCIGTSIAPKPDRVAAVILETGATIVGVQEVECRPGRRPSDMQDERLAGLTGMTGIPGTTVHRPDSRYGNLLLTCHPVTAVRHHDLSWRHREPRGAIDATLDVPGGPLRVVTTHFGLTGAERREQAARFLALLRDGPLDRVVVLGDFNEWRRDGPVRRGMEELFGPAPAPRTYPARWPLFRLDRIWAGSRGALFGVGVHATLAARRASDHLPVVGRCRFPVTAPAAGPR